MQFLSLARYNNLVPHRPRQDLEAFFWCFVYLLIRNGPSIFNGRIELKTSPQRHRHLRAFDHFQTHPEFYRTKQALLSKIAKGGITSSLTVIANLLRWFALQIDEAYDSMRNVSLKLRQKDRAQQSIEFGNSADLSAIDRAIAEAVTMVATTQLTHQKLIDFLEKSITEGDWSQDLSPAVPYKVPPKLESATVAPRRGLLVQEPRVVSSGISGSIGPSFPYSADTGPPATSNEHSPQTTPNEDDSNKGIHEPIRLSSGTSDAVHSDLGMRPFAPFPTALTLRRLRKHTATSQGVAVIQDNTGRRPNGAAQGLVGNGTGKAVRSRAQDTKNLRAKRTIQESSDDAIESYNSDKWQKTGNATKKRVTGNVESDAMKVTEDDVGLSGSALLDPPLPSAPAPGSGRAPRTYLRKNKGKVVGSRIL